MPRKAKQAALCAALTLRAREGKLVVVENFTTDGKTKSVATALAALGAPQPTTKALVVDGISPNKKHHADGKEVTAKANANLIRGAKNLASSQWLAADGINVYDILRHEILVLTEDAAKTIQSTLTGAA
jgi:large subunit ribosomal protein L4